MVKDVVHQFDRLVTYAKKGDLHSKRLAASVLKKYDVNDVDALDKLFTDLAKRFENRNGGYLRVLKLENRRGDNAPRRLLVLAD